MSPRTVKGTRDLLPPETAVWAAVEETARRVFGLYAYREIRTPIFEETELFVRSVGESSDIVGKEMYTFEDRGGRSLTLRPESTASVARAFVQHGLGTWPAPVKLFYIGPQFRCENVQAGRYRQFHQIGAELLGDPGPWTDVEVLLMLVRFLAALGLADLVVKLNTVGDRESRQHYRERLVAYLEPHREVLGADSQRRLEQNPLRILDTKLPRERELLRDAPSLEGSLSDASREHFDAVKQGLEEHGVRYVVDPTLVRGLDYYTRTVFEIASEQLGAQDAILGGGRYDGLIADLGGAEIPGIGFAIGEDRLIDVLPASFREQVALEPPVVVVGVGAVPPLVVLRLAEELRALGRQVEVELSGRSLKAGLKRAARLEARWVVLLGEEELKSDTLTVKDFATGEQEAVARAEVAAYLRQQVARGASA